MDASRSRHVTWRSVGDEARNRVRGFQLWLALPPALELGPSVASFQAPEQIATNGSVRVLLGSYNGVESPIEAPSPINYLSVTLEPGERWEYIPPRGHTVLWASPVEGERLLLGSHVERGAARGRGAHRKARR